MISFLRMLTRANVRPKPNIDTMPSFTRQAHTSGCSPQLPSKDRDYRPTLFSNRDLVRDLWVNQFTETTPTTLQKRRLGLKSYHLPDYTPGTVCPQFIKKFSNVKLIRQLMSKKVCRFFSFMVWKSLFATCVLFFSVLFTVYPFVVYAIIFSASVLSTWCLVQLKTLCPCKCLWRSSLPFCKSYNNNKKVCMHAQRCQSTWKPTYSLLFCSLFMHFLNSLEKNQSLSIPAPLPATMILPNEYCSTLSTCVGGGTLASLF